MRRICGTERRVRTRSNDYLRRSYELSPHPSTSPESINVLKGTLKVMTAHKVDFSNESTLLRVWSTRQTLKGLGLDPRHPNTREAPRDTNVSLLSWESGGVVVWEVTHKCRFKSRWGERR